MFLKVHRVGREVAEGSVLGDDVAATGREILVDGGQVLVGRGTVVRWVLWDGVAIVGGILTVDGGRLGVEGTTVVEGLLPEDRWSV